MPRYFFHLVEGDRRVEDCQGVEFEDLVAAKRGVESTVRNQLVSMILNDDEPDGREYEIADSDGRILDTIHFRDYVPPQLTS